MVRWLKEIGLSLKPEKTQVVHTLERHEREPGFDFLRFNIRQYPAGKTRSTQYPPGRCLGFTTTIKNRESAGNVDCTFERAISRRRITCVQEHREERTLGRIYNSCIATVMTASRLVTARHA